MVDRSWHDPPVRPASVCPGFWDPGFWDPGLWDPGLWDPGLWDPKAFCSAEREGFFPFCRTEPAAGSDLENRRL